MNFFTIFGVSSVESSDTIISQSSTESSIELITLSNIVTIFVPSLYDGIPTDTVFKLP